MLNRQRAFIQEFAGLLALITHFFPQIACLKQGRTDWHFRGKWVNVIRMTRNEGKKGHRETGKERRRLQDCRRYLVGGR